MKDKNRTLAFGTQSITTTLLVLAIVGVVNFLAVQYPKRIDLTKNKINTLSGQSVQVVQGLKSEIKATAFVKAEQREAIRSLFSNYQALNPKFTVEYVDPDKEPARTQQAGVKALGTILLKSGDKEARIDSLTEEKLTNELIKLTRARSIVVCWITDHGEKDFKANTQEGYTAAAKSLTNQSYEIIPLQLVTSGKIPEACSAIIVMGPTKGFFPQETKIISDYLKQGGKALFALDLHVQGNPLDPSPEMVGIVKEWMIEPQLALVIDPVSRVLNYEPTMPLIATFAKDSEITKGLQKNSLFPLTRPLTLGKNPPATLKLKWLLQTTPNSWGETNMKSLNQGEVRFDEGDMRGPVYVAASAEGKLNSKAPKDSRLVVFGTSNFASNQFIRFGNNLDLFANAVSWVIHDDSLISIRSNDDAGGLIQLSQSQGTIVFYITVIFAPLLTGLAGLLIWMRRRKL